MFRTISSIVMGLALLGPGAGVAFGETGEDDQVSRAITSSVNKYTQFTVFDDVDVKVKDGVVTLTGDVTMPHKRDDIEKRVAKIDGVRWVHNQINVMPASQFDDDLRVAIARSIYGNANFWQYAIGPNAPIRIIVDHGHVTLRGVVNNNADRMLARAIASRFPSFSFTSELKTSAELRASLDSAE